MPDDRYEFLALLERDLPEYIVCQPCKKLHSIEKAHQYDWTLPKNQSLGEYQRPCYLEDRIARHGRYISSSFSYPLFRMTMKRFRQGRDHVDLLKILSSRTLIWSETYVSLQRCYLTRIVDGSVLIREQTTILYRRPNSTDLPWYEISSALDSLYICAHGRGLHEFALNFIFNENNGSPNAGWKQLENNCRRLMMNGCKFCKTEFRIDFKELGYHGIALFVTKWMDLGDGQLSDPRWQKRLPLRRNTEKPIEMEYEIGSIATGFEGGGISRFDFDSEFHFETITTAKEKKALYRLHQSKFKYSRHSQLSQRMMAAVSDTCSMAAVSLCELLRRIFDTDGSIRIGGARLSRDTDYFVGSTEDV